MIVKLLPTNNPVLDCIMKIMKTDIKIFAMLNTLKNLFLNFIRYRWIGNRTDNNIPRMPELKNRNLTPSTKLCLF